jgi:hypothetical protein
LAQHDGTTLLRIGFSLKLPPTPHELIPPTYRDHVYSPSGCPASSISPTSQDGTYAPELVNLQNKQYGQATFLIFDFEKPPFDGDPRQAHQFIPFPLGKLGAAQLSYILNSQQYPDSEIPEYALLKEREHSMLQDLAATEYKEEINYETFPCFALPPATYLKLESKSVVMMLQPIKLCRPSSLSFHLAYSTCALPSFTTPSALCVKNFLKYGNGSKATEVSMHKL